MLAHSLSEKASSFLFCLSLPGSAGRILSEFDRIHRTTFETIATIRTISFIRPGSHFANTQTSITAITGVSLENTEKSHALEKLQHPAGGTNKAAPQIRNNQACCYQTKHNKCASQPEGGSMLKRKFNGIPEFTDPNRHHHPRIVYSETDNENNQNCRKCAQWRKLQPAITNAHFYQCHFPKYLIEKATRAKPTAKGPPKKQHRHRQ